MARPQIRLQRDDYEALHFAVLAGGNRIGAGAYVEDQVNTPSSYAGAPDDCRCIHGYARMLDGQAFGPLSSSLSRAGLTTCLNDRLVTSSEDGVCPKALGLTFAQFCKKGNIVPVD